MSSLAADTRIRPDPLTAAFVDLLAATTKVLPEHVRALLKMDRE